MADPHSHLPGDEAERQRALDALHIVGSLPEPAYEDIVRVAAAVCGTPMALVTLIDRDRQWFKARTGVEGSQTDRNVAVCDHAIRQPEDLMEIGDLQLDSRFAENPVLKEMGARFYAGMPLVTGDGAAVGSVCVVDLNPRELNDTQRDALKALARLTMALMEARSREREQAVAEILNQGLELEASNAPESAGEYSVVIMELQDLDALSARLGERGLAKQLQALDLRLEQCLQPARGDSINRVTGSGEFIAVLGTEQAADTLTALHEVAEEIRHTLGTPLLMGSAGTRTGEPTSAVFLRADQALSAAKDTHPAER
ncbi:GAF domain-containing protein [Stenotrophomonas sp. CFBP 13725]|uniref:GAF domain-containing protein n=1 Tax=Stenotrophomonas sp. CFBP 13725 TaxID=2775297 RepID=UPI001780A0AD|nr:GAF domain-containing protein [Stenotrophomonas sp. CFBP 13725]MBD8635841.1 GAF domain-containing protein [Stenotrophomonas sp. CFBP 13725]